MHETAAPETRSRILIVILSLFLTASIAVAPVFLSTEAKVAKGKGLSEQTKSHDESLPNFDIRTDKGSYKKLALLRERIGKSAVDVANFRDDFVRGESTLKNRVASLQVVYGPHSRTPEVIGTDVLNGKASLAHPSGSRADTVKQFVAQNASLFGIRPDQASRLKVLADYQNPEGGMSFVRLEQEINGIKVFGGEVQGGFGKDGELVRVINNLAAGASETARDTFGDPAAAYEIAISNLGRASELDRLEPGRFSTDGRYKFGQGDFAPVAEKVYFPTEPGVVVPAWLVLIWQPVNAFYLVVDVESGSVLWRKNISEDQTQAATYSVYANPNSMLNVAESPAPLTPGPVSPLLGTQGSLISRSSISLIGNEGSYSFNNLGWITDGANSTAGNAVIAGPDRDCLTSNGQCQTVTIPTNPPVIVNIPNDGVDSAVTGSSNRNFTFNYNPAPGNPAPGESPLPAGTAVNVCVASPSAPSEHQKGAVTQLFYITNRYHDETYRLGFTEAARNFQNDNFGRNPGGSTVNARAGNDRISAEAQDCSGANNANFSTPADGTRGRMQMYIFTGPSPDRDGSLDADIVVHELTHGLSNRLVGNGSGLSGNMARGLGEGWSDFYALSMLSDAADPVNGVYAAGGYSTFQIAQGFTANYYYGIRRFPYAVLSFTGGPNNRPHNPLTFADIDSTQASISDGAFPPAFTGPPVDEVHNMGEVWSTMLWEIRGRYVARLGGLEGNRRVLQHVTDGMKLSPLNPTFVDARNAIVAAALAGGTAEDVKDIWEGFALRGLGASAQVTNTGSGGGGTTRVIQAFDLPNLQQPGVTVSDAITGDNDGFAEPGERVRISIPLRNETGNTATNVFATLVGGGTLSYGSIAHNGTASNDFTFTIPANIGCGAVLDLTINVTSSLGPVSFTRKIPIGIPQTTLTENFDGVAAPTLPNGWTAASVSGGPNFVVSTLDPNSAPNSMYALEPSTVGGGTDLTSPSIAIGAAASTLSFRHKYDTEAGWDGGLVEISIGGGSYQDIITAGGSFIENGYNGQLGMNVEGNSPLGGRNAWSGSSGGYITTRMMLPPSAAGQNVRIRWRFGSDDNTVAPVVNPGWFIDNVEVTGSYACSFTPSGNVRSDFNGDRRSDIAVFRPSDGSWWSLPSGGPGFSRFAWGMKGDILTPGDFDDDGKTDYAIYRPGQDGRNIFWVFRSSNQTHTAISWGVNGDIPLVRDYDGDGRADYAVYRPSQGVWYILKADGGFQGYNFGLPGDVPVAGDFDGDGRGDLTLYRNGQWITRKSSNGSVVTTNWGLGSDMPVPADYDNDGKDDYAVFRPSDGSWWILYSSTGQHAWLRWGMNGDVPVPGDYDGDGRYDPAVYRNGQWWILNSTGGHSFTNFGLPAGDLPVEKAYIP